MIFPSHIPHDVLSSLSFRLSGFLVAGVTVQESSEDGKHLLISCTLSVNHVSIKTFALVDTSTTGYAFLDMEFASLHSIPTSRLVIPRSIEVIDGSPIDSRDVTHGTYIGLHINGHEEKIPAFITKLDPTH